MSPKNNTNPKNTPPAGTKTHKANCPCPVCKRVRGRQEPTGAPKVGAVAIGRTDMPFASPITVPSIAEAHELASNPKALELAQKLAKVEGELERSRVAQANVLMERSREIGAANETIEECRNRIEQLREQLTVTEGGAKIDQLAFRAAMWGAVEMLSAGSVRISADDPRFLNTPPAELAGLLIEAVEYGRIGIEMTATVEELLEIEGDPKEWRAQVRHAIDTKIEAAEGPLRAERDQLLGELSTAQIGFRAAIETENTAARVTVWCVSGLVGLICALLGLWAGLWLIGGRS